MSKTKNESTSRETAPDTQGLQKVRVNVVEDLGYLLARHWLGQRSRLPSPEGATDRFHSLPIGINSDLVR